MGHTPNGECLHRILSITWLVVILSVSEGSFLPDNNYSDVKRAGPIKAPYTEINVKIMVNMVFYCQGLPFGGLGHFPVRGGDAYGDVDGAIQLWFTYRGYYFLMFDT